uniref:B30.2/SPRY domain-containing protein n=1 Tax=Anopheles christyi TaxID=43041 RepID=A0A182K308_9DIPT
MAYTTQKQFLSISFPNEDPRLPSRKRSDAVLKSYSSCYDNRAWSLDVLKQSQFIGDVANRTLTQAAKAPLHSFSGAELTKEILVRLDADNLADYILSLRDEVKKKNVSIESLEQVKADLNKTTEQLDEKLKALDEENRLLRAEIERIGACQEQQRQTNQFDEAELAEISQMIIDLRDYNENLEEEMQLLRNQLQTTAAESSVGDNHHVNVEAENNFLKFKAKDYDRLESELALFKAEYDNLTHQKRELAEELQRSQQYRLRAVELKQNLKEELHRREMCEEQIEMLVNMFEQQSVELSQLKHQVQTFDRTSQDRLFDESTEDPDGSQTMERQNITEDADDEKLVETISFEKVSASCRNCTEHLETIADLKREIAAFQAQGIKVTETYDALREISMADNQELERVKLQLEQLSSVTDTPVGQLELFAANEKLTTLQRENEKLQKDLSENKARILELETKVQSNTSALAGGSTVGECCAEKATKISDLEQIISDLKEASNAMSVVSPEENANLLQRITILEKELQERDQKLKTLQETVDKSDRPTSDEAASVDSAQLSSLLSQLAEKNEMIKQLRDGKDTTAADDARACQEELVKLRVRLEACEEDAAGTLVSDMIPEPRKSVRISDEVEEFEPLSIKEELGSEQDEKETEEIKSEPEVEHEESEGAYDDGSETSIGRSKRLNSSLEKLEELQDNLSKRCTLAGMMGRQPGGECDCIQAIAFKVAQGGLEMLLVAELYVLLQEICSAITRKNAVLGRNVTMLANSMTKCWQVITDARVMMNMELTNRTNHHQSIPAQCIAVQEVREEDMDNRIRTASHMGHLSRPSGSSGMVETRPLIPLHQSMSVGSDDNRHSNALDVQRGGPCSGLNFSNENQTVSVDGYEHRVALGSVGFSRGVHYWEFTIDKYTADTDPAFGVARLDVARDKMLGKDDKGFAMYIDRQRSWFQHNSVHERRVEGGISTGSTVGVLLDLERHTLHFIVNEMPQGSVAFRDLYGVFYPAVSVNRGVTLTLHTGLDAPRMDYH